MKKYYRLLSNQDYIGGVAYSPSDFMKFKSLQSGTEIRDWVVPIFELREGEYRDHLANDTFSDLCSEEFKNVLDSMKGVSDVIQWLEVDIKSEEHKDRRYYVLHISKYFDVLDKANTLYSAPHLVIKPVLKRSNLGEHKVFGYEGGRNNVIVVEDIKRALEKIKGIKNQISFTEVKIN